MSLRQIALSIAFAASVTLQGCGPGFQAATPPGFIELEQPGEYDYRATTADGLVIGARELENPSHGELGFWTRAIENRMRMAGGYALLRTRPIKSRDGVPGVELRFGRDRGSTPHLYYVALFATPDKLCLVEVGGERDAVAKNAAQVDWAIAQFAVD